MLILIILLGVETMNKSAIVFLALICSLSAFTILQKDHSAAPKAINWPFTICGKGQWTIEKLTLNATPKRDTTNDIDVLGTATADTAFTNAYINVKLNGVFLHDETVDFKKSFSEGDTIEFKYQNFIPSFAPPGTYGLQITFKNNGKDNGCISFSFKL